MTQQETQEKALARSLQAAVDNLNAAFDNVHRAGLVVSTDLQKRKMLANGQIIEGPPGTAVTIDPSKGEFVTLRFFTEVLRKVVL